MNTKFITVSERNAGHYGLFCIKNPKYPGFDLKLNWLKARIKEGLLLRLVLVDNEVAGFIEYVPGEYAWRPVEASGYIFIHCIWVYPKKFHHKGLGALLLDDAMDEARQKGMKGVVAQVSTGTWMASPELFYKNGFEVVEQKGRFQLVVKKLNKDADNPMFIDWEKPNGDFSGLQLYYANQCPLFSKSVEEMKATAKGFGFELDVNVIETAEQARNSPSGYGVYGLMYNGKVLADHYISNTRFANILKKLKK